MMTPLRFGICGLGWPGFRHAHALSHVPETRLVAACDLDPARRQQCAAEFSDVSLHSTYEELLRDSDVDAVIVALPNFLHFPATVAALEAGRHVLCEKPPALDANEMAAIRDLAADRGLTYAFGRQFRFTADMLAARELVAAGGLGDVYYARAQWLRLRGAPAGADGWFTRRAHSGGGVVIDLGVHSLDAAWYLAGCPTPLTVSASVGRHFLEGSADVEDSGFAFLRFAGGLSVILEVAWAINMSDVGAIPAEWLGFEAINTTLHGSRAALQVSPPRLFSVEGDRRLAERPLPTGEPDAFEALPYPLPGFARQLADFVFAVRTGAEPTNNATQAVELMRMLSGVYESARCGAEVRLDGPEGAPLTLGATPKAAATFV